MSQRGSSIGVRGRVAAAVSLGLTLAMIVSSTSFAHVVVGQSGLTGDYGTYDSPSTPGARCGYSQPDNTGEAYFRWMKVLPPLMGARDVTANRDHQQVSWQFKVQRSVNGGPWKNVASSPVQTRTAYDDAVAAFAPMKVYYNGTSFQDLRALLTIKWIRGGSAEGWVKLRLEYYGVKWTVGDPSYVYTDACDGSAD